jgi:hypothetical protein
MASDRASASGPGPRGSLLLAVVRFLRGMPKPRIAREEAIRRAAEEMRHHGVDRAPNAPVFEHLKEWEVWALDGPLCSNMVVRVDMHSGMARAHTTHRGPSEAPGGPPSQESR